MALYDYVNEVWRDARCDANGRTDVIVEKGSITPVQASGATQIAKSIITSGAIDDLHEVTAGKTLHLVSWTMTAEAGANGVLDTQFYVTNAGNTTQYRIVQRYVKADETFVLSGCFPVPLTIEAGWKIKVMSAGANVNVSVFISGYEV